MVEEEDEYDEEIFDDTDFYQHLLREIIASKQVAQQPASPITSSKHTDCVHTKSTDTQDSE